MVSISISSAVAINFAVALFVLLSKRKKETLNKLIALCSDVMSQLTGCVITDRRSTPLHNCGFYQTSFARPKLHFFQTNTVSHIANLSDVFMHFTGTYEYMYQKNIRMFTLLYFCPHAC